MHFYPKTMDTQSGSTGAWDGSEAHSAWSLVCKCAQLQLPPLHDTGRNLGYVLTYLQHLPWAHENCLAVQGQIRTHAYGGAKCYPIKRRTHAYGGTIYCSIPIFTILLPPREQLCNRSCSNKQQYSSLVTRTSLPCHEWYICESCFREQRSASFGRKHLW